MGVGESWAWSPMEPPAKGRRGYTFAHTEYVLVATFKLGDHMHQICGAYAKHMLVYSYKILLQMNTNIKQTRTYRGSYTAYSWVYMRCIC